MNGVQTIGPPGNSQEYLLNVFFPLHPSCHRLNPGSSLGQSSEYRMPRLCLVLRGCVPSQEPCPVPFLLLSTCLTTARLLFTPRSFLKTCWHCPMYRNRVQPSLPTHVALPLPSSMSSHAVFSCLPEHFAVPEICHIASQLHTPGHVVPVTGIIAGFVHLSCLSSKTKLESLP